jgi:protein-S-isoprenylcysteine O-methyltransferase Ste14
MRHTPAPGERGKNAAFSLSTMNARFRDHILAVAPFLERYVLSGAYFWLAYRQGLILQRIALQWPLYEGRFAPHLAEAVNCTILVLVQLLVGTFLLTSRPPVVPPRKLREVFVPLLSCSYFVLYSLVPQMPAGLVQNGFGGPVPIACTLAGLFFGIIGPALSLWGVLSLGKSFGVFVSVREMVQRGPYRFVRHPIYLGYVFIWLGLLLVNLSPAFLLLVLGHFFLFRHRAKLEEQRLGEAIPDYLAYQKRTGFLFPRGINLSARDADR